MTIAEIEAKAKAGDRIGAGADLTVGLMAHDPSDPLRLGYGLGSALISAASLLSLTSNEMAAVAEKVVRPLLDAAKGVSKEFTSEYDADVSGDAPWFENEELAPAVAEMRRALVGFGVANPDGGFE